ncbi:MAG: ImmA/IrrE family metallo-endopeptidase [Nitrospinae bacterium]|nr:ImmA/IrrE family metallo-endopeptidase [Nitrospinota bacterium]
MAKALGEAFDVSAEFFTNLQNAYDLSKAKKPDPGIAIRRQIQNHYPLREMILRGWINNADTSLMGAQLARFFEVDSLGNVPHLAHAAKKSSRYYEEIPAIQLAWLFRVRQLAKSMHVSAYSHKALLQATEKMKLLLNSPEEIRHVPRLLQESGVRIVVVEGLPGGKIDGVCFWLHRQAPVIGLSLRFDRIDNFWFVLRHEIEHVLQKHGLDREIIDVSLETGDTAGNQEEEIANNAASEFCIPQREVKSFYDRKWPFISARDVVAFAMRMNVHPGIIVGQIQRRAKRWDFLRDYQVKIRHLLLPYIYVDGWGDIPQVDL